MSRQVLIPAAGQARRMAGRDKLLEPVGGVPVLRVMAQRALASGARVIVTLPCGGYGPGRQVALDGLDLVLRPVPDAGAGLSASLIAGSAGVTGPLMILLPDMPGIGAGDLLRLWQAAEADPDRVWRGAEAASGRPGHPVILPPALVGQIAGLRGDEGARRLIAAAEAGGAPRPGLVPLPGRAATDDLDTPADWQRWRAAEAGHDPATG